MKVYATIAEIREEIEARFYRQTGKILDEGWQLEVELLRGWKIQKENLIASATHGLYRSKSTEAIQPTQHHETQPSRGTQSELNFRSER